MDDSIGKLFMERTKYPYLKTSEQDRGLPQPPLELPYTGPEPAIDLPDPKAIDLGRVPLRQVIDERRSVRGYADQALSLEELSFLLWCTQGVKKVTTRPATSRTVPSAGARHAFETDLLVNRVEGLEPGLYRFLAIEHQLVRREAGPEINERITHACLEQNQVRTSAVTFIWDAVRARMYWRYGERGYRYLHLDAGHVCQNLYLAAEAIGCGVCAIAAFDDNLINGVLGLDGEHEFVIYIASLGKKRIREER